MSKFRFTVVVEQDNKGYFGFCPELQGCYTQGETYEELLRNIKDAIHLHLEDRLCQHRFKIPQNAELKVR